MCRIYMKKERITFGDKVVLSFLFENYKNIYIFKILSDDIDPHK